MKYIVELLVDTEALEIGAGPKGVVREVASILEAACVDKDQVSFKSIRKEGVCGVLISN